MAFKSPCSGRAAIGAVLFDGPLSFKEEMNDYEANVVLV
jgi:hypothetical protein